MVDLTILQSDIRRVAHLLADVARIETLNLFRSDVLKSDNKLIDGFDPVTAADRSAEAAMRKILAIERPDDGILGEEMGAKEGTSGLAWVLDPIDGTRGYISGTPTWGVLIAVSDLGGPIYGIIDQPYIGERFEGGFGIAELVGPHGTRQLTTRASRPLSQATVLTTFPEVGSKAEALAFHSVASQALLTRYGMDCYGYALVALGQVDLVIEAELQPYDIQAPIAVVQAAGGIVTDWAGGPAHMGGTAIAAANPDIHAEALAILKATVG
jgi:myo-inositol-1(or 4)-monophosphatase